MSVRIVRLGSPRHEHEGLRIGTVRRPPRGVAKDRLAAENWYDLWYPNLAPAADTIKMAQQASTQQQWAAFKNQYRKEMNTPENRHAIALLAALSQQTDFSVGCYCADESHCHRSVLRELLAASGAKLMD